MLMATTIALVVASAVVTRAAGPPVVQTYYVPFPEDKLLQTFQYLWGGRSSSLNQYYPVDPMSTVVNITVPLADTIVYYDHWEDGYEPDLESPQQVTTQVWGDGNTANGVPPGIPSDVIQPGQVVGLYNQLDSTTLQAVIDYDARDKIGTSKGVAVVRTGWASQSNTLMAGAVEIYHSGVWGTDYRAPVGEDILQTDHYDQFDYVAFVINAGEG